MCAQGQNGNEAWRMRGLHSGQAAVQAVQYVRVMAGQ